MLCANLFILVSTCFPINANSKSMRLIEDWPYEKLFKQAELVVFAKPEKTELTNDTPPNHVWPYELVAQNTTLKIKHTLKGKAENEKIKVLHFKFGELKKDVPKDNIADHFIIDGPLLVSFRTKSVLVTPGKTVEMKKVILDAPEYMLFLKRMKDGRFEPISGRIDPAQSVREISEAREEIISDGR